MKNFKFILAAFAALLFAACSSDTMLDQVEEPVVEEIAPINFGLGVNRTHRATFVGADAANMLGKQFVVLGMKGNGTDAVNTTKVFDHYLVQWSENTANSTESNTADWEYVGNVLSPQYSTSGSGLQTIKYWDYTSTRYDFIGYSPSSCTIVKDTDPTAGQLKISAIDPANATTAAYTVKGVADDLAKFYIADMVTMTKESVGTPALPRFDTEVTLSFRHLASKMRLAMYETVPGYSVKDVKFYSDETTAGAGEAYIYDKDGNATFYNDGTYTVYYPTVGTTNVANSDFNKAHVSFVSDNSSANRVFSALDNFVAPEFDEAADNYIGRTAPAASYTFDATAGDKGYKLVLPNENGTSFRIKVDYTLVAVDGSGEEIKVSGATADVPAIYAKWLPGYAYTYIFKISKDSNGSTGEPGTDPAGLYPITFDAVVVNTEDGEQEQQTITTISDYSVTTYQNGILNLDEYKKGVDLFTMVQNGATTKGDLNVNGGYYKITAGTNINEKTVANALNVGSTESPAGTFTGRNGIVLVKQTSQNTVTTVPGVDGNVINVTAGQADKFTPADAGTYAYVYYTGTDNADTWENTAVKPAAGTDVSSGYYTDFECTTPATGTADGSTIFYQKVENKNRVYSVKVIKVV